MIRYLVLVLFMASPLAADPGAESAELIRQGTALLLDGAPLPADFTAKLGQLPAAERIVVLVFLRRSGLLTEPVWSVERILAPVATLGAVE